MFYRALIIIITLILLYGCGGDGSSGDGDISYFVRIENQSQFDIHHLFIYSEEQTYFNVESMLEEGELLAAEGGFKEFFLSPQTGQYYRVTVTRQLHQFSELYAYTTGDILTINENSILTYFDNQFRLESYSGDKTVKSIYPVLIQTVNVD